MVAAPSGAFGGGRIDGRVGVRGYGDTRGATRGGVSVRGGISGALTGASLGSAIAPGPGTLIGALGGGLLGSGVLSGARGATGPASEGRGATGGVGDSGTIMGSGRASPAPGTIASAMKKFTRPSAMQAPAWARFEPVMTDLQRRSYIATEGLSGNQGLYRSGEAKDYYKNLLGQMFISPLGQPQGDLGQLLPIEQQYLMALGVPEFKDVPGLLTALGY
jgi:hypothetical protein